MFGRDRQLEDRVARLERELAELRVSLKVFEATDVARAAALKDAAKHIQRTISREQRRETLANRQEEDDEESIDELLDRVRRGERIHPGDGEDDD